MFSTSILLMSLSVGSVQAEENNIPTPTFLSSPVTKAQEVMTIQRIAGCYGNLKEARNNIRPSKGILQEPLFQYDSYTNGVFDITTPSCILDDNPKGLRPLNMSTMRFEDYLYVQFECGCGDCYIDENTYFAEDEVLAHATEEHKKDYAAYKIKRDKEVAKGKVLHEKYKTEYERWTGVREKNLKNESIRITITPKQDLPAGTLTVYNYRWQLWSWCGDTNQVNRMDINSKEFSHPAIKRGEQLSIWLDNANTDISWGVVLHDGQMSSQKIMEHIGEEAGRRQKEGQELQGLPEIFKGKMIETEPGRASDIVDECCAC